MTTGASPGLTDHDRRTIARARTLIDVALRDVDPDALGELVGEPYPDLVYPAAFGMARSLLRQLVDLAERLGGGVTEAVDDGHSCANPHCLHPDCERLGGGGPQ
jgi:hypothetical protein